MSSQTVYGKYNYVMLYVMLYDINPGYVFGINPGYISGIILVINMLYCYLSK